MSPAAAAEGATIRRARLIGKGWIQGVALVMLFGFTVMGLLAYRTYTNSMPQPERVVTESGETLFTSQDITEGQKLFQARGLMEYGSILGHGGYLGPERQGAARLPGSRGPGHRHQGDAANQPL